MQEKGLGNHLIISRPPIRATHAHSSTLSSEVCQEWSKEMQVTDRLS